MFVRRALDVEDGPEMALRRWNFVTVEGRGRLFPLSRSIVRRTDLEGVLRISKWMKGFFRGNN